ncbi:MAG: hypothetical protein Q4G49_08220, partial [Paracoccus sp. (in: a-proteobacteria)]|nr:hypothetical protein [Paracoccus sp. (in: a-proteobacteria)]
MLMTRYQVSSEPRLSDMSTESNVTESDPGIEPAPGGYELLYVYSFGRYHDQFDLPEGSWRPGQLYHDPQAYEGMPDDPTPEEYVDYVTRKDFFGQGNYSDWTDEQLTDGVFMFTGSPDTISPTSIRISDKDYRFEDQDDTGQIMEDPLPLQWSATDDTIIPAGT